MVFLNRKSEPKAQASTAQQPALAAAAALDRQPSFPGAGATATATAARVEAPTSANEAPEEVESVIGNDFSIEGQTITIRCKGSLRVNGNIQANLHSRRLVVGEAARITGAIVAEEIAVHGQVEGTISGAVVKLEPSAVVEGDIQAHKLSIDNGARFEGRSQWVQNPAEIAPQVEPPLQAGRLADFNAPHAPQMDFAAANGLRANPPPSAAKSTHDAMHNILTPLPGRIPN